MVIKLSTTIDKNLFLNYRMPADKSTQKPPVIEIYLPPRALLCEVEFTSQEHYEEFKKQNLQLFNSGIVIESQKIKEKELKAIQDKNNQINMKRVSDTINKNVEKLHVIADEANIKLNTNIERTPKQKA